MGQHLDNLNQKIEKLEALWDRLDSQGNQSSKQQLITKQLERLRKDKARWDKLYAAVKEEVSKFLRDK